MKTKLLVVNVVYAVVYTKLKYTVLYTWNIYNVIDQYPLNKKFLIILKYLYTFII